MNKHPHKSRLEKPDEPNRNGSCFFSYGPISCNTAEQGWYFNRLVQISVGHHNTVPETLISDAGPIVPACDSEQPQK